MDPWHALRAGSGTRTPWDSAPIFHQPISKTGPALLILAYATFLYLQPNFAKGAGTKHYIFPQVVMTLARLAVGFQDRVSDFIIAIELSRKLISLEQFSEGSGHRFASV